ncbi:MAG: AtpZ/AtpI family protein [Candidatus Hydrogenedentes bacterium]|nr:AtpZ/AtpI family protein [Candidatus Hydrogenedentota bacterium]
MKYQDPLIYDDEEIHEPPMIDLANPEVAPIAEKKIVYNDSPWSALGMITQLGLVMAFCIVGSTLGGVYIDRMIGSNGIAVLIMIPVGIGAAVLAAWQIIRQELP